jgi:dihydrodipicolinate synthase/N-acetylneuraminate lyase
MEEQSISGVFAVPPLARRTTSDRSIDFDQNDIIVKHIVQGGVTRLLYGGNAFLYHISLLEFEALIEWLSGLDSGLWPIPSIGPSFGRAIEQAQLLRKHKFPCAMVLPSGDPRDAAGLERGLREIADAASLPLILYIKDEPNFGSDPEAGLDVVGRLVDEGICTWIKYAVVRDDPRVDPYLDSLLRRVPRKRVISGIGERPAIVHMREWKLPGFTTGSGCLAPSLSQQIYEDCVAGKFENASATRELFLPHEDLRDAWGPARVLHHSTELSGLAQAGPILPYVSALSEPQLETLAPVARALVAAASTLKATG